MMMYNTCATLVQTNQPASCKNVHGHTVCTFLVCFTSHQFAKSNVQNTKCCSALLLQNHEEHSCTNQTHMHNVWHQVLLHLKVCTFAKPSGVEVAFSEPMHSINKHKLVHASTKSLTSSWLCHPPHPTAGDCDSRNTQHPAATLHPARKKHTLKWTSTIIVAQKMQSTCSATEALSKRQIVKTPVQI